MPRAAAPHSTASIWSRVGVTTRCGCFRLKRARTPGTSSRYHTSTAATSDRATVRPGMIHVCGSTGGGGDDGVSVDGGTTVAVGEAVDAGDGAAVDTGVVR